MSESVTQLAREELGRSGAAGLLLAPASASSAKALARMCRQGIAVRPHRRLYALRSTWETLSTREQYLMRIRSLASLHPDWIFCLHSAAALYGLELSNVAMRSIHIVSSRSGFDGGIHRHHLRRIEPIRHDGIPVTPFAHTVWSSIENLDFAYALGTADSALRLLDCTADEFLAGVPRRLRETRSHAYAADVISYADKRSENGGESFARAIMIEQGVMLPELQVEHRDPIANVRYRVDFEWRLTTHIVAGELDGADKYTRIAHARGASLEDVMRDERQRESRLRNLGMKFARFTFDQVRSVKPYIAILDSCGIPRIGENLRSPRR